jgi:hypothetical protein
MPCFAVAPTKVPLQGGIDGTAGTAVRKGRRIYTLSPRGGSLIGKISPRAPTQTGPHLLDSQPAKHSSHDISVSHLLDSRPMVCDGPGVGLLPELSERELQNRNTLYYTNRIVSFGANHGPWLNLEQGHFPACRNLVHACG